MQKTIEDQQLGSIVLKKLSRSRHYTIRIRNGKISISLPLYGTYRQAIELLEKHRDTLASKLENSRKITPLSEAEISDLRKKAKAYLPDRLRILADIHGFSYTSVSINKSRTRWGSCSSKKSINLSLYLILVPAHLIDYVLLHELCHTIHMNHGSEFWSLMDKVCNGKTMQFRKELKKLHIPA